MKIKIIGVFFILNILNTLIASQLTAPLHGVQQYAWAQDMLQRMTLREKIGQLFFVAVSHVAEGQEILASQLVQFPPMHREYVEKHIKEGHVGGIIFLRKSGLNEQLSLTNHYQNMSKLPLMVVEDLEWGLPMRISGTVKFPYNMTLGAIQNESLIYELGQEIGRQCRAIGVHVNLAPVIDVNNNAANPVIGYRSFSENKEKVARLGRAMMRGLQNAGILACAKHFPGHGDTDVDSHVGLPVINHDRTRLDNLELYPFRILIEAGVGAIMNAHLMIPALDKDNISTLSYKIITQLLKTDLGFRGLIMTDALNMGALKGYEIGELELKALVEGNHILLCPMDASRAVDYIEQAVHKGIIAAKDIDERVLNILQVKESM